MYLEQLNYNYIGNTIHYYFCQFNFLKSTIISPLVQYFCGTLTSPNRPKTGIVGRLPVIVDCTFNKLKCLHVLPPSVLVHGTSEFQVQNSYWYCYR